MANANPSRMAGGRQTVDELKAELVDAGVDLDEIQGTGTNGNLVRRDLVRKLEEVSSTERKGPRMGKRGEYLPATYRVGSGNLRRDH